MSAYIDGARKRSSKGLARLNQRLELSAPDEREVGVDPAHPLALILEKNRLPGLVPDLGRLVVSADRRAWPYRDILSQAKMAEAELRVVRVRTALSSSRWPAVAAVPVMVLCRCSMHPGDASRSLASSKGKEMALFRAPQQE